MKNNFKEVLVALEMVKKKEKNEKKSKRWAALLGAVVVDSKGYTGIVEDCCCDYETVDSVNAEVLRGALFYKRLPSSGVTVPFGPKTFFCHAEEDLLSLFCVCPLPWRVPCTPVCPPEELYNNECPRKFRQQKGQLKD
ncbi:hypothetical protein Prudu_011848 [Prunus dulcis]|uniref:Uncharacterized protein n=1 Tax=Prunus dulcis TaxID=3755 RepID=A0A4Y1RC01_PRUDU|nr:hypothetical protein Prudu_011848 [Prunus dulcis]